MITKPATDRVSVALDLICRPCGCTGACGHTTRILIEQAVAQHVLPLVRHIIGGRSEAPGSRSKAPEPGIQKSGRHEATLEVVVRALDFRVFLVFLKLCNELHSASLRGFEAIFL